MNIPFLFIEDLLSHLQPQPCEMLLIQCLINPCQESCRCYDPSFMDVEQASVGFCS